MPHYQHSPAHLDIHGLHTLQSPISPSMPSISEDEATIQPKSMAHHGRQDFQKTHSYSSGRRESLLTQSLLSESESHNEDQFVARQPSRSSTCSTFSDHSHPFTSDEGVISPSTRASTPGSPPRSLLFRKVSPRDRSTEHTPVARSQASASPSPRTNTASASESEPQVEATLGRKRCITFACGRTQPKAKPEPEVKAPVAPAEPPKRQCTIKFACPTKWSSKCLGKEPAPSTARHYSPAPARTSKPASPALPRTRHRDSDTTIKYESPKSVRKSPLHLRRPSNDPDMGKCEATRFHEFASSDEEAEDWTNERTVYPNRLTVGDTLRKETEIRNLHEKAEEEALEEEEEEEEDEYPLTGEDDDDELSELEDDGFQTDDEEGFAETDEEDSDDGSDYEWWAPRGRSRGRSPAPATMLPPQETRFSFSRGHSPASVRSVSSSYLSPLRTAPRAQIKKSQPLRFRSDSAELPDSTDFVCGTLDEDRPLEQAFMNSIAQRKAAKHRPTPQDIDPTFPTSDPDANTDEEDEVDDEVPEKAEESDAHPHIRGGFDNLHMDNGHKRRSPRYSPKRVKSPAPLSRTASHKMSPKRAKSPAPPMLKRTTSHKVSPKRKPSPAPATMTRKRSPEPQRGRCPVPKIVTENSPPKALFDQASRMIRLPPTPSSKPVSPPPSRRGSETHSPNFIPVAFGTAFLGHRPQLTHTSSLPRSPNAFQRRAPSAGPRLHRKPSKHLGREPIDEVAEEEDEGETAGEDEDKPYTRGAIDIVQSLERTRLRRRQKFMEKYQRKEDKKRARGDVKRPKPGQGAQRMRQIGIDCSIYHGKRVLSY